MQGYQTPKNRIMAKGETWRENSGQVLETKFYLNRFTSHRATKTWGSRKLFYSNLFSLTVCLILNDSKWFTSELFVSLFHKEQLPAKIQLAIASDSADNDNPTVWYVLPQQTPCIFAWAHRREKLVKGCPSLAIIQTMSNSFSIFCLSSSDTRRRALGRGASLGSAWQRRWVTGLQRPLVWLWWSPHMIIGLSVVELHLGLLYFLCLVHDNCCLLRFIAGLFFNSFRALTLLCDRLVLGLVI